MVVSGLALLLGALLVVRQPQARRLTRGPLLVCWYALMALAVLSLLWSANRYSTVLWVVQWGMAGVAFWLAAVIAGETQGRLWMVRAYLASAGLFGIGSLVMFFTSPYPRLIGTFYWPNPAAAYLIPAVLVGLDEARRAGARSGNWWMLASTGFLTLFWLTDSRAATLVLALMVVIYLAIVKLNRAFWIRLLFIGVLSIGLAGGLNWLSTKVAHHQAGLVPGSRFGQVAGGEPTSLRDRLSYLSSSMAIWQTHPWGGTGAGTFGDVHPQFQQRVVSASKNAHNLFVQSLAELGVLGVLALAGVGVALVSGGLRGLTETPEMLPMALGVVGLVIHFGLDIDASYPALLMLAAVLAGLIYSQGRMRRGRAWWLVPVAALALLVPAVSLYQSEQWAQRAQSAQLEGEYALAAADFAKSHNGLVYNPDYVSAEGIDWYVMAGTGGASNAQDIANALQRARQAQAQDPADGQHWQLEGRTLALRAEFAKAQQALRQALRRDPFNHPGYALDLATFQLLAGDQAGAKHTADAMLALYPKSVVDNRNIDQTVRPELANLEALVGNIDLVRGDLAGAQQAADGALGLDKTSLRGRALKVQVLKKLAAGK
jgi:O-antigen ligase/Flp pilus assembly protein TadD